jgi:hypothetical protein
MVLDPSADVGRKVWRHCSYCPNTESLYLLEANANFVYVQCPLCHTRWWLDTGFGVGKQAEHPEVPPSWPHSGPLEH